MYSDEATTHAADTYHHSAQPKPLSTRARLVFAALALAVVGGVAAVVTTSSKPDTAPATTPTSVKTSLTAG